MAARPKVKVRGATPPDPDEEAAQAAAAAAVAAARGRSPDEIATACISAWVQARARLVAEKAETAFLVFDYKDAHTRGAIEAALPAIADELSFIDPKTPFFDLPKEQVIDIILIGAEYSGQAWVYVQEARGRVL